MISDQYKAELYQTAEQIILQGKCFDFLSFCKKLFFDSHFGPEIEPYVAEIYIEVSKRPEAAPYRRYMFPEKELRGLNLKGLYKELCSPCALGELRPLTQFFELHNLRQKLEEIADDFVVLFDEKIAPYWAGLIKDKIDDDSHIDSLLDNYELDCDGVEDARACFSQFELIVLMKEGVIWLSDDYLLPRIYRIVDSIVEDSYDELTTLYKRVIEVIGAADDDTPNSDWAIERMQRDIYSFADDVWAHYDEEVEKQERICRLAEGASWSLTKQGIAACSKFMKSAVNEEFVSITVDEGCCQVKAGGLTYEFPDPEGEGLAEFVIAKKHFRTLLSFEDETLYLEYHNKVLTINNNTRFKVVSGS